MKLIVLLIAILISNHNISAHPWGGLVLDKKGSIYFTFTEPFVGDHHYACVWKIDNNQAPLPVLKSAHSPSDLILSRTPARTIYAAERNHAGSGYQSRLWKINDAEKELIIPPTTDEASFHIQAYAVTDRGTIFFAQKNKLYQKEADGTVRQIKTTDTFTSIDALAWGPNQNLYIIDRGSIKILDGNSTLSTLATDLKQTHPEDLPFSGANILFDLAIDEKGNVYVAYYGNRRILKVTPDGTVSDFLYARPWSPHGVDIYQGNIYVLESTSYGSWWKFWEKNITIPRIRKVDGDGHVSTVFEYHP